MPKQNHARGIIVWGLLLLLLTVSFVCPGSSTAQDLAGQFKPSPGGNQNGTFCPQKIHLTSMDQWAMIFFDGTCDASGNFQPIDGTPPTTGPRQSCYVDGNPSPGLDVSCEPCPPDWPRCTPCDDYLDQCGDQTPDPDPENPDDPCDLCYGMLQPSY